MPIQWRGFCSGSAGLWWKGVAQRWGMFVTGGLECGVRIMAGDFFAGAFVPGVYLTWALSGAPSYLSSRKSSTKLDNLRPSYGDLTYWTWSPSAICDFRRPLTPYVAGPHCLHTHQHWCTCIYLYRQWWYAPRMEFEKMPPGGKILLLV